MTLFYFFAPLRPPMNRGKFREKHILRYLRYQREKYKLRDLREIISKFAS